MSEHRHDDQRTLNTIADNLDTLGQHYQAEQLRLIGKRIRQMRITLDETLGELELVEGAARVREEAIARGEAIRLRCLAPFLSDVDASGPWPAA